jgi:LysM repeat protein
VASGETLASIGKRYGMSPGSIAAANGLAAASSTASPTGKRLVIPVAHREDRAAPKRTVATRHPVAVAAAPAAKKHYKGSASVTHTASNRGPHASGAE